MVLETTRHPYKQTSIEHFFLIDSMHAPVRSKLILRLFDGLLYRFSSEKVVRLVALRGVETRKIQHNNNE
jgi:hypothetical protein